MTKVQRDAHGQFVRAGGHIFRPVSTKYSYPTHLTLRDSQPVFEDGTLVNARHVPQTPFALVRLMNPTTVGRGVTARAHWWSHGIYIGPGGKWKPSAECWEPDLSSLTHVRNEW